MSKQEITLTNEQIDELINYLQGSCISFDTALMELFNIKSFTDLDNKNLEEIDSHIFECDSCGWWYDLGEQSNEVEEDSVCTSCEDEYLNSGDRWC